MSNKALEELKKLTESGEGWWIFTFGFGQKFAGHYVRIWGTKETSRQKMIDRYGTEWGFQYSEKRWQEWLERKPEYIPAETEMEVIR